MKTFHFLILAAGLFLLQGLSPSCAQAYIDPGTGSMLVQALIAAVTAVGVSVGLFWSRIKSLLGRKLGRGDNRDAGSETD